MAASYTKFESFVGELGLGAHNLNTGTIKAVLTLTAPVVTNDVLANLTQIANGNGYTTGGEDTQNTYSESSGTGTLAGTKIVWTSSGAGMAQFRYVAIYNDTHATDGLIGFWDYSVGLTLAVGETFTILFNGADPTGTIATIA